VITATTNCATDLIIWSGNAVTAKVREASVSRLVLEMGRMTPLVSVFTSAASLGYFPPEPPEAIPSIGRLDMVPQSVRLRS
jgi:hypothetical protein